MGRSRSPSPPEDRPQALTATSLAALPPSTQNVLRDGKIVAVRDSDEDDSDSVISLTEIFGRKKENDDTSASSPFEADEARLETERRKALSTFTNGRSDIALGKQRLRDILATKNTRKHDARKYLKHQEGHLATTQSLKQAQAKYNSTVQALDAETPRNDMISTFQRYLNTTSDDAEKLLGAVERTDALSQDLSYSFFGTAGMRDWTNSPAEPTSFPHEAVPCELFRSYDEQARSRTFASGMLRDLARQGLLQHGALSWAFSTFAAETDDELRFAYIRCLEQGATLWARNNLTAADVQQCFRSLSTNPAQMELSTELKFACQLRQPVSIQTKHLLAVLDCFARISTHMNFEALSVLASITCCIAIDACLMANSSIAAKVEDLLSTILGTNDAYEAACYVASHIMTEMTEKLHEPALQALLLQHIHPVTRVASTLRIRLANAFILGVSNTSPPFSASTPPTIDLSALTTYISTSDDFATARLRTTLNYANLRARTAILDAAISTGGRPGIFPSPLYTRPRDFNQQVDALAAAVRKTWTAIADTGATHMKRTEAKEKLDAVYQRLLYCVRTEPLPKKHIFDQFTGKYGEGDAVRDREKGRERMKGFLDRAKEARLAAEVKKENAPLVPDLDMDDAVVTKGEMVHRVSSSNDSSGMEQEFVDAREMQRASVSPS